MTSPDHGTPQNAGDPHASSATPADISAGHEVNDFAPRPVAWFGVGMLVLLAVVFAVVWPLMHFVHIRWVRTSVSERLRTEPGSASFAKAPPQAGENGAPLLQIVPEEDLADMRSRDAAELLTYGWIDARNRIVRLPIGRAMDLVAERGLPPTGPANRTMLEMQREPHPVEDQPRPKQ